MGTRYALRIGQQLLGIPVIAIILAGCVQNPAAPVEASAREVTSEYRIGPGDLLNVFVYRSPELSAQVPVRPDGRISTPLSPDVVAVGRTPSELAQEIEAKLARYVQQPNVTVMVSSFGGPFARQIRVVGQVAELRAIPYQANMTLLDVLIACKGLTQFAAGNRATIVRKEPDGTETFNVKLDDLLKDGDMSQNVAMAPGDILVVPQTWF